MGNAEWGIWRRLLNFAFRIPNSTFLILLLLLCALLFFFRLGDRSLSSSHEARAAQNAQSILDNGNWLLPQLFDRQVELQKPPFFYWLVAWLAQWQGGRVNALSVRLPAALAASATVLIVFLFGLLRQRPLAGFLAAAMLATCLHFTWLARVGRIDMPLTFAVTLCLFGFYLAQCNWQGQDGKGAWVWLFIAYAAMGLGLLLKGPIAMILPLAVVFPSLIRRLRLSIFHELGLWWGLPLAIGIAAPWYVLANQATRGDLFQIFFWHHNIARGVGSAEALAAYPWWYYAPRLIIDLFPWSLLLVPAAWVFFRSKNLRRDPLARFGLLWFAVMFIFFSAMQFKRADYLLPLYPGVALFLGCVTERIWNQLKQQSESLIWRRVVPAFALGVVFCMVTGWVVYVSWQVRAEVQNGWQESFAQEIRRRTQSPVVFFRTEAHDVAFHTGAPIATVLEWENLEAWATRKRAFYVVMPAEEASARRRHLRKGQLQEIPLGFDVSTNSIERPLVLLRTQSATD